MKKYICGSFYKVVSAIGFGALFLSGIGIAQEGQNASFSMIAETDSERTKGRHYTVTQYLDDECNKPKKNSRLYRKKFVKDQTEFDSIDIGASQLFVFQVDYGEERRDSERECSAAFGFTPQPGRTYKASYKVSGQVSRCEITVMDVTEGQTPVEAELMPERMCTKKGKKGNPNGVASHNLFDRF